MSSPATASPQNLSPTPSSTGTTPRTLPTCASGITPTVSNVVATFDLSCRVEGAIIAKHARNVEYKPKRFSAAILRLRSPKTTALVFASGKVVVTGARSEDDSRLACRKFARIIQKIGYKATCKDFKVQNVVGSCDSKLMIRLEGIMASGHANYATYEPEEFPGLVYKMGEKVGQGTKIVLLVFSKGKVVITGSKSREQLYAAWEAMYPILMEYRIVN